MNMASAVHPMVSELTTKSEFYLVITAPGSHEIAGRMRIISAFRAQNQYLQEENKSVQKFAIFSPEPETIVFSC